MQHLCNFLELKKQARFTRKFNILNILILIYQKLLLLLLLLFKLFPTYIVLLKFPASITTIIIPWGIFGKQNLYFNFTKTTVSFVIPSKEDMKRSPSVVNKVSGVRHFSYYDGTTTPGYKNTPIISVISAKIIEVQC